MDPILKPAVYIGKKDGRIYAALVEEGDLNAAHRAIGVAIGLKDPSSVDLDGLYLVEKIRPGEAIEIAPGKPAA